MVKVVAIDGPVAVGKSTVARRVAEELRYRHIDTGAMYRAVAWRVMELGQEDGDYDRVAAEVALSIKIDLTHDAQVIVDGVDITNEIRDESVSRFVSLIADVREVREAMVREQRRLGREQESVLEGRDIGTVVFPDAQFKIYLDASPQVRVDRRKAQLDSIGRPASREEILQGLMERDKRDRNREWGALKLADDATLIDTTELDEDIVAGLICSIVREHEAIQQEAGAAR